MIQVTPEYRAALFATDNQPVDLYELMLDGGTLRFADQNITWNGSLYSAAITGRSAIKRYDGGQFDGVRIQIANTDTTAAQTFLTQNVEGRRIVVRKVDRTVSNDSIVLFHGIMRRVGRIDESTVELEAEELLASIDQDIPGRLFTSSCNWVFKGDRCGYSGAGATCDRSWAKCNSYANTHRFGGFRFFGQTGSYQFQDTETKRFLLLFRRKKKVTVTASFSSVDDTPYDVPIPIVLGRVQLAGVPIQHVDEGGITKVLAAMCVGPVEEMFYPRANQANSPDWSWHSGADGVPGGQDSRFPSSYPYSRLAYVGVTIPSDIRTEDAAPTITAVIRGVIPDYFDAAGAYAGFAWTDNPIWLTRHLLTLPLEEGGGGVPYDWFDDAVNYAEAAYCAESVVDATNGSKIYYPTDLPTGTAYRAYRPTGVIGGDPSADGPYGIFGVSDDDTSLAPVTLNVRRFTLNTAIAKQAKLSDVIFKKLFAAYRGFLTYSKAGKIQLRVERPTTTSPMVSAIAAGATTLTTNLPYFAVGDSILLSPFTAQAEVRQVLTATDGTITFAATTYAHAAGSAIFKIAMAFDDANMIGTAAYPLQDRQSSVNRVVVKYSNPAAAFAEQVVHVNDYEHQAQIHRVNSVEVDGSAIDSFFQAYRIGQFQMRKFRELGKFVEFRGNITATLLEIGDVIAVSAVECGLQAVPFRVIDMGFEINDEVSIVAQLYDAGAYDDTAPQSTVTVPAIFGAVSGVGGGPGPEVPNDVTDVTGSWAPANGGRLAVLTVNYTAPVAGDFAGVRATYQVGSGAVIPAGLYDYPGAVVIEIPAPNPAAAVTVKLASRTALYEKPVDGSTPSVTIAAVGGSIEAENVTSVTAVPSFDGERWGVSGVVAFGSNRGSIARCELHVIGPYTAGGAVIDGYTITRRFSDFTPPPTGNFNYAIEPNWPRFGNDQQFLVELKVFNGFDEPTANPTRSAKFTVSAVNQTTQATGFSVSAVYSSTNDTADGIDQFAANCFWTNANDADFEMTVIWVEKQLNPVGPVWEKRGRYIETGPNGVGAGFSQSGIGEVIDATPATPTVYRFTCVSMTKAGDERPGAPTYDVTVSAQAAKLKATRLAPSTLSTEFANFGAYVGINQFSGTKITDDSIFSQKLWSYALDLGGGGAKPARIRIFDPFNVLRAYMGIDPFGYGLDSVAWFGSLRVGPNVLAPKIYMDTAGNLTIDGGTFNLNSGGITTAIKNLVDGFSISGLSVAVTGGFKRSLVAAGEIVLYNTSSVYVAWLSAASGYGFLSLRDAFGTQRILLDGSQGSISCSRFSGGNAGDFYSLGLYAPRTNFASSGSAGALPSFPDGYLYVQISDGSLKKIAYYN